MSIIKATNGIVDVVVIFRCSMTPLSEDMELNPNIITTSTSFFSFFACIIDTMDLLGIKFQVFSR